MVLSSVVARVSNTNLRRLNGQSYTLLRREKRKKDITVIGHCIKEIRRSIELFSKVE
ncbi:hypothetical protein Goshw_013922, partial [Gossypium schwendimanii]|nr:hypothetical protein [Gossypium schwendimanii]